MPHPNELLRQRERVGTQQQIMMSHHGRQRRRDAVQRIQNTWRNKQHESKVNAADERDWVLLPILIFPGVASSGLVIEESGLPHPERYEGSRVWFNPAFLASTRLKKKVVNQEDLGKSDDPKKRQSAFRSSELTVQVRSAWTHHMSLAENMVDERPGNKVRPYPGLEAVEYLTDDCLTRIGSWVFSPVTNFLVKQMGYVKGKNLDGAPYDWRLPPSVTETRDGYLSNTIEKVEEMFEVNGQLPVILLGHSMGCKMAHYFLNFALAKKGQTWIDKYIHTYMPVGAPHGGASNPVRTCVTGKGLADQVDMALEGDDQGLVLHRSWGSGPWLIPRKLPPNALPSCIVWWEGELGLKVVGSIQVGPLFAKRRKLPQDLRLTLVFRNHIQAHTKFKPVTINAKDDDGEIIDATISFDETFYLTVPELGADNHLGGLNFHLEEPGGQIMQNPSKFRQMVQATTSWAPVRSLKKRCAQWCREHAKRRGKAMRVAVSTHPWHLQVSQFGLSNNIADAPSFLRREISMCGCVGNIETTIDESCRTESTDSLSSNSQDVTIPVDNKPKVDQPLGALCVKVSYRPPPKPATFRGDATPVAAITPGMTPVIPIVDRNKSLVNNQEMPGFDIWSGHDLLEHDRCNKNIWSVLDKYYEGDPLGPNTKSAMDAPPVKRLRAIYGINQPTEVCAVFWRRPVIVVGDEKADSGYVLDTNTTFPSKSHKMVQANPWAKGNLYDYKMDQGHIFETPKTLQDIPSKPQQRRVCGDGTVPYWSLVHCLSWNDAIPDLAIDELDGAEHRGILADVRFHALLKRYCKVRDPRVSATQ